MSSAVVSALLIEAPVNRHFAQLHRDSQALTDAVTLYVETGLRRGNSVVVFSAPERAELLLTRLREHDLDPSTFLKSGQFELHDAAQTLRTLMRNDMPDWESVRRAAGTMFERVRAFGRGTTRAYGEMVNMLWQEGNHAAAIRLDEYWSELMRLYPFSLFCSYMLDVYHDHTYEGPLEEIGRTHSDILGSSEDEQFRVALDAASRDVLGVPLSQVVSFSRHRDSSERRFPLGQRTMLWVKRNLPSVSAALLERARRYYEGSLQ